MILELSQELKLRLKVEVNTGIVFSVDWDYILNQTL